MNPNSEYDYYFLFDPIFFIKSETHKNKVDELKRILVKKRSILILPKKYKHLAKMEYKGCEMIFMHSRSLPSVSKKLDSMFILSNISISSINVVFPMMTYAINKKFKIINLHGVKHDWISMITVNEKNQIVYTPEGIERNSPRILKDYRGRILNMTEFLRTQLKNFRAHDRYRVVADNLGIKIINHQTDSFITSYTKI